MTTSSRVPTGALDVTRAREHLIAALEADLIGPYEKPGGLDVSGEFLKLRTGPRCTTELLHDRGASHLGRRKEVPATSVRVPTDS